MEEEGIKGMTIDWDTADRITLACLVEHYKMNENGISVLEKKGDLEPYQQSDLDDSYAYRNHFKKIIRYFTTEDQYEELLK